MDVKEIRDVIHALKAFVEVGKEVMEDGQVNFLDLPKLAKVWGPLQDAINGADSIPAQWSDADKDEMKVLAVDAIEVIFAVLALFKPAA